MPYYARVTFETDASAMERHDDLAQARRWIEEERRSKPELFRSGQIMDTAPNRPVIATCDVTGWGDL